MIDPLEAKAIVYRRINEPDLSWPDKPEMIILDEHTVEKDYVGVFYWTSSPWHETGDIQFAIAGNGPMLVSRETGAIYHCGTAAPIENGLKSRNRDYSPISN